MKGKQGKERVRKEGTMGLKGWERRGEKGERERGKERKLKGKRKGREGGERENKLRERKGNKEDLWVKGEERGGK